MFVSSLLSNPLSTADNSVFVLFILILPEVTKFATQELYTVQKGPRGKMPDRLEHKNTNYTQTTNNYTIQVTIQIYIPLIGQILNNLLNQMDHTTSLSMLELNNKGTECQNKITKELRKKNTHTHKHKKGVKFSTLSSFREYY